MRVRLGFRCPHGGSASIRALWKPVFRDPFLRILGIRPYRCRICRTRFYLFKSKTLKALVSALSRPASGKRVAGTELLCCRNAGGAGCSGMLQGTIAPGSGDVQTAVKLRHFTQDCAAFRTVQALVSTLLW
jgi:hypothetical protein